MPEYITQLFNKKQHNIEKFSCGIKELDTYLKQQAGQETKKMVTAVYIIRKIKSAEVIGYYTLSTNSIELTNLPESSIRKLPKYKALPALLIGRLAIDINYQGQGIGEKMLLDALNRSYLLSKQVGCFAVIVDAKDKKSSNFYEKYGFKRSIKKPYKLYLPMLTIINLIEDQ